MDPIRLALAASDAPDLSLRLCWPNYRCARRLPPYDEGEHNEGFYHQFRIQKCRRCLTILMAIKRQCLLAPYQSDGARFERRLAAERRALRGNRIRHGRDFDYVWRADRWPSAQLQAIIWLIVATVWYHHCKAFGVRGELCDCFWTMGMAAVQPNAQGA